MKTKSTKAGGLYPKTINGEVLLRTLGPEQMKVLWAKYQQNKLKKTLIEPTKLQYKLAEDRKSGMTARAVAEKHKAKEHQVHAALRQVAMWEYMKK